MQLYLMRHAQAAAMTIDPRRNLTAVGRQEIEDVLSRLPPGAHKIAHVMHSGVQRTAETAQMVADYLNVNNVTIASQWLGESAGIEACLQDIPTWTENTLLVSHFPFLNQLVNHLVIGECVHAPIVQFSTATMVCLKKTEQGTWIIHWVVSPDLE